MKIAPSIRIEIAQTIVQESQPGYDRRYYGESYAVDTDNDDILDCVMFEPANAPWHPWPNGAYAVPLAEMIPDYIISHMTKITTTGTTPPLTLYCRNCQNRPDIQCNSTVTPLI